MHPWRWSTPRTRRPYGLHRNVSVWRRWRERWQTASVGRSIRSERGSAVILFAVALSALLGVSALVVDAGLLYVERARLQTAVDAAALGGLQELPGDTLSAELLALDYAERNGAEAHHVTVEVDPGGYGLTVRASRPVELYFARILGFATTNVAARARAVTGTLAAGRGAAPFGIEKQEWDFGVEYELKYGSGQDSGSYRGNFMPLALGGTGSSVYRDNLKHGYGDVLRAGTWAPTEPGNMKGPTAEGVQHLIDSDDGTCEFGPEVNSRCSRLVLAPIIESLEVSGRSDVKVVGFAAFYLEDAAEEDGTVWGRFIEASMDGEIGGAEYHGAMAMSLVD